jgi:hypothetical protein
MIILLEATQMGGSCQQHSAQLSGSCQQHSAQLSGSCQQHSAQLSGSCQQHSAQLSGSCQQHSAQLRAVKLRGQCCCNAKTTGCWLLMPTGGLGLTAILSAKVEPYRPWAAHLASFGAQAALVAESAYYKLLIGRVLGYKEENIRHHIRVRMSCWEAAGKLRVHRGTCS